MRDRRPDMPARAAASTSLLTVTFSRCSLTSTTARSSGMSTPTVSAKPRKPQVSLGRQTPP